MKTISGTSIITMILDAAPLVLVLLLGIVSYHAYIWENLCSWFTVPATPAPGNYKGADSRMSPEEREAVIAELKRLKRSPQLLSRR
jgi:hypothetical protein